MKKAEQSETTSNLSEEEIITEKVREFRSKLDDLNTLYRDILKSHKVYAHFYIGPNMTYTNLPDQARFEKQNIIRY